MIFYLSINKLIFLVAELLDAFQYLTLVLLHCNSSLNSKTVEKLKAMRAATVISMIHACVAINVGKA